MLRRLEQIKNYGIFEDFKWDAAVPEFERINLIYGSNGAGKTSLARALDSLHAERGGFGNVSIRMSSADRANERTSSQSHDTEFDRVFVFSESYVSRSHNFEGDAEVDAVLTLGERSVEDEKRIIELNELIETAESDLTNATNAVRLADKALDSEYTSVARGIVTALSRAGGDYRSNGSYNKGTVRTRFTASSGTWALLTDQEKAAALATVTSDEKQRVQTKSYSLSIREQLHEEIAAALVASPVSIVLDTLKEHEEASSWVESGRHLHQGLDTCIFCGGDLTDDRKQQIEQHFSDEVEKAQHTTDSLIHEIKALQSASQILLGDGALGGSLFEDLRASFNTARTAASRQVEELDAWLNGVLRALEKKRTNVVANVDFELAESPVVDGSQIENILNEHNERVTQHVTLVQEAAKKVELHLLKEAEATVAELSQRASDATAEKTQVETSLRAHREEISAPENVEGDPLPSAEVMAKELARILGRNELSFELLDDGKHYRVTRHGAPARDLSTGERTAISLIHFLEHVKTSASSLGNSIVIVDDPVSSLDSGVAMGISTYIWSEALTKNHIEQVFLLTHNFELFRQWDIQIEGLRGCRGPKNKHGFTSNTYELTAPYRNVFGTMKRVPRFMVWPPSKETRVKVRSSYHHAFITVARVYEELASDCSMDKQLDALLLYPNVLRRILETFLAFKSPSTVGNFTVAMRSFGAKLEELGYKGDGDGLRLQLTRFTHAYSHAESPETNDAPSPEEIGAMISAVFTFMNAVDEPHFLGLCDVVGVDPSSLLVEAPSVSSSD